jgi:hypothetical protein
LSGRSGASRRCIVVLPRPRANKGATTTGERERLLMRTRRRGGTRPPREGSEESKGSGGQGEYEQSTPADLLPFAHMQTAARRLPLTRTAPPCVMKEGKSAAAGEGSEEGGGGRGEYKQSMEHHLKIVRRLIVLQTNYFLLYMMFSNEIATVDVRARKKRSRHPSKSPVSSNRDSVP